MRKFITLSVIAIALISLIAAASIWFFVVSKLPTTQEIQSIRLQIPMRVYTSDNKLLAEFGEKRRVPLAYDDIPKSMIEAFIAAEDDRFFDHHGVDVFGLMRAVLQLIKTGRKSQGGSTITMQTARNVFLSRKKTYMRKLSEILLAIKMERHLSKEQILQLYLNKIFLGNRSYGVGAAAQAYYGKALDQLTLAEVAMIAGLPKAPSRYNPVVNAKRAKTRRDYVLGRMLTLGFIDASEYEVAMADPVTAMKHGRLSEVKAPYLAEMVRAFMVKHYGEKAYTDGYRITTTVTAELQELANRAVRKNLIDYDTRHGYRGIEASLVNDSELGSLSEPMQLQVLKERWVNGIRRFPVIGGLLPAVVIAVKEKEIVVATRHGREILIPWQGLSWARHFINENQTGTAPIVAADIVKLGDVVRVTITTTGKGYWRLAQIPLVEGALISLDPNNGAILTFVGGFDFTNNKFNHITQARRQLGSNFKPFLYSAALKYNYTPATLVNDAPVVFNDSALETVWRPENYSGKFSGPTRLRKALYTSRNLVSIRLLQALGVQRVIDYTTTRFGFTKSKLPKNLSLALGSSSMPLLDVARGYAVFANGGYLVSPFFIQKIEDRNDTVLFEASPVTVCKECVLQPNSDPGNNLKNQGEDVIDNESDSLRRPKNIALRTVDERNVYLMTSIMRDVIAKGTGRRARSLKRKDLAGKTGTTNDQKDAWFSGFNQDIVATVWVGFDKIRSLGARETGSRAALPMWIEFMKGALNQFPEKPLARPLGLATVRIDPKTGKRVRPSKKGFMLEVFREENIPEYLAKKKAQTPFYESPETLF